ncbi:5996_t:CDS:1, partial [Dentiscutata heterogama]
MSNSCLHSFTKLVSLLIKRNSISSLLSVLILIALYGAEIIDLFSSNLNPRSHFSSKLARIWPSLEGELLKNDWNIEAKFAKCSVI